jgi:hypothetical protein
VVGDVAGRRWPGRRTPRWKVLLPGGSDVRAGSGPPGRADAGVVECLLFASHRVDGLAGPVYATLAVVVMDRRSAGPGPRVRGVGCLLVPWVKVGTGGCGHAACGLRCGFVDVEYLYRASVRGCGLFFLFTDGRTEARGAEDRGALGCLLLGPEGVGSAGSSGPAGRPAGLADAVLCGARGVRWAARSATMAASFWRGVGRASAGLSAAVPLRSRSGCPPRRNAVGKTGGSPFPFL